MPTHEHVTVNVPDFWLRQFPFPKHDAHKYTRGHVLICGGAIMTGATRLAARAAQRIGAGLVTLAVPQSAIAIYAADMESVIVRAVDDIAAWQALLTNDKVNTILIGPGLGLGDRQKEFVLAALATRKPCVLDADALNNFADTPEILFASLHNQCVLTPHEGEFARLFGRQIDGTLDKAVRTQRAAALTGCVVLLKGADTYIADAAGQILLNTNAPPWLATAGAGDVLAGIIAGLLVQNMPVFMATAAAAWIHGQIARDFGPGLIAEDIVAGIPGTLKSLSQAAGISISGAPAT